METSRIIHKGDAQSDGRSDEEDLYLWSLTFDHWKLTERIVELNVCQK